MYRDFGYRSRTSKKKNKAKTKEMYSKAKDAEEAALGKQCFWNLGVFDPIEAYLISRTVETAKLASHSNNTMPRHH